MSTLPRGVVIPAPARLAFGAVQAMSPTLAARLVERWFFTPPRTTLSTEAKAFVRMGQRFTVLVDGRAVVGWTWGAGPVIYLVHGWGGLGGRLGAFARPLVEAGCMVVTFDAPGHGESGRGLSSMPEFARALRAVAERHGPARAVVAHSLGGAAAALAAGWGGWGGRRGLAAERFALLAPSADPAAFADAFATVLGARPDVMARVRVNSERRLRFNWTDLDVCAVASRMSAPLLVVHDEGDDIVPFAEGAAIAASWPGAQLLTTTGLGHRGILRDPAIVAAVVRFVADAETIGGPAGAGETARLEHELFDRETRWR